MLRKTSTLYQRRARYVNDQKCEVGCAIGDNRENYLMFSTVVG